MKNCEIKDIVSECVDFIDGVDYEYCFADEIDKLKKEIEIKANDE